MKRASAFDFFYAGMIMFLLIVITVVASFAWSTFATAWSTSDASQGSKDLVADIESNWYPTFDSGVAIMFFLFWVVAVCLAFYLDNSSIFFVVYLIIGAIMLFCLAALGLFFPALQETSLGTTINQLPITNFIMNSWLAFLVFFLLSVGGALYAKNKVTA